MDSLAQNKLFKAIKRENVKEVERLIKLKNVDVNARHELGWSPLHLAAVNGRLEVDQEVYVLHKKFYFPDRESVDLCRSGCEC